MSLPHGVHLTIPPPKGGESILTNEALEFLAMLHRTFNTRRKELLENRKAVQAELDKVGVKLCSTLRSGNKGAQASTQLHLCLASLRERPC